MPSQPYRKNGKKRKNKKNKEIKKKIPKIENPSNQQLIEEIIKEISKDSI